MSEKTQDEVESDRHETTEFRQDDNDVQDVNVDHYFDSTFSTMDVGSDDLGEFLSRPVSIFETNWTSVADIRIAPMLLWLQNPAVLAKVQNYSYLRGNLKVKIMITGSPFVYGRAYAAFVPLETLILPLNLLKNNLTNGDIEGNRAFVSYLTQQKIGGYLNPSTGANLTLECPLITPKNAIRLGEDGQAGQASFGQNIDIDTHGRLLIKTVSPLRAANPAAGETLSITIKIFAWMEDAVLSIPTTRIYTAMMKKKKSKKKRKKTAAPDYGDNKPARKPTVSINKPSNGPTKEDQETVSKTGIVSNMATKAATFLDTLEHVPIIGSYAMAGSAVMTSVGNFASLFGFAMPTAKVPADMYIDMQNPNFCATSGTYQGYKMSVDPLNAVTIDPSVANVTTEDEMSFSSWLDREVYLDTITLTNTDNPLTATACVWRCNVTPELYHPTDGSGLQTVFIPMPSAHIAKAFKYWRGPVQFRFQVVKSQFHRAVVAINYVSQVDNQVDRSATTDIPSNTTFLKTYDLESLDGACIEVDYMQSYPFKHCQVTDPGTIENDHFVPNAVLPSAQQTQQDSRLSNGYIQMLVVNKLQGPTEDTTPVEINVLVSFKGMRFMGPRALSPIASDQPDIGPGMLFPAMMTANKEMDIKDSCTSHTNFGPDGNEGDWATVFGGETVVSWRAMMKRFLSVIKIDTAASTGLALDLPIYPNFRRIYALNYFDGVTGVSLPVMGLYDFLAPCYIGARGSYRWIAQGYSSTSQSGTLTMQNTTGTSSVPNNFTDGITNADTIGVEGGISSRDLVRGEVPYYSANRFLRADGISFEGRQSLTTNSNYTLGDYPGVLITAGFHSDVAVSAAAGDDFSFLYFLGAPPVFRN